MTPRYTSSLILAAFLGIGLTACADRSTPSMETGGGAQDTASVPPNDDDAVPEPDGGAPDAEALPPTKQGTILLEGTREPITLKLYESPASFGLPFVTYYPEDLMPQAVSPEEGEVVRFQANMGGVPNEDAVVGVYVHPEGTTEQDARNMLQTVVNSYNEHETPENPSFPWAIDEYRVNDGSIIGRYALGRHGGRYFHVMITYPPEYGDGFGPRTQIVLDEWRWKDTGTGFTPE